MHSILKRSAALIASAATLLGGGMLMAGTAQADGIGLPVMTIHPAASTSYPKELVNGDFQTFGNRIVDKTFRRLAVPLVRRRQRHGHGRLERATMGEGGRLGCREIRLEIQ